MATIRQKNEIFLAFQKAKSSGVEYPIKEVEKQKLPGCFAGCMFESKWGVARREQTWELLCATAPAMCKKHKELPNSLRRILGFEAMALQARRQRDATFRLPWGGQLRE